MPLPGAVGVSESVSLVLYDAIFGAQSRYAAVLNGGYNGLVRKTEVEALIEKLAPLDANEALAEE